MTATQTAAALLKAIRSRKDFAASIAALCDLFEEHGRAHDVRHIRRVKAPARWLSESLEAKAVERGLAAWADCPCHMEGVALHEAVVAIDLDAVPGFCNVRSPGRSELAKMARKLFAMLGLKGISVTVPNHSMASGVDVKLPSRLDVTPTDPRTQSFSDCPVRVANRACERKVMSILLRAFPATEDRSDSQTDYFDRIWSVD